MKLKFKHQRFQTDAAQAICDVFTGQPYSTATYMIDKGVNHVKVEDNEQLNMLKADKNKKDKHFIGFKNKEIAPQLTDSVILGNLQEIQRKYQIKPSDRLEGKYNLTVEMETGVGKTYTYIKTMYELNKRFGWSKFIVVVPSIAIREGVHKSFEITQEHFAEEYNKKIKFFIYNSSKLNEIDQFANDSGINVMIINSQAFNAKGKDARRIYMKLDSFRSRRPIDIIASANPILIIDEPQSVEGTATKEGLKHFKPLITLRYSATHKKDSIYNMVYRLDAIEAYNKKLVKKISVKGITVTGSTATDGYVYLQSVNIFKDKKPSATIEFDLKGADRIRKVAKTVNEGFNLFQNSELDEYKDGYTISRIDGRDNSITFTNGKKVYAGDVIGEVNEDHLRRIQIRETILSHIARERQLFKKGIKVLSLFFIDEVAKYKQYDEHSNAFNGVYAEMFEEEYNNALSFQLNFNDSDDYIQYLMEIKAESTHAGYFSIDKKSKKMVNPETKRGQSSSDDTDAYDLIMRNKERLLDRKEPIRFIFSHSALKEGWDNPNVFQICTLKKSGENADVRKRQEIGRGLRLSVNQDGERMDSGVLKESVHDINILTVIANESYESFTKALQDETAELVADRPREVNAELFDGHLIVDANGEQQVIDIQLAKKINNSLIRNDYVDDNGILTETYYQAKDSGTLVVPEELKGYEDAIVNILDTIYNPNETKPDDARKNNLQLELDEEKFNKKEFKELWSRINAKSAYVVNFDAEELTQKAIKSLDKNLSVTRLFVSVAVGAMNTIKSKDELKKGESFDSAIVEREVLDLSNSSVKYDLIGKIVEDTALTRKTVSKILQGIRKETFDQFKANPEDFIIKASNLINEEKATVIIQHIEYNKLEAVYDTDIFTEPTLKAFDNKKAIEVSKHLYNYVVCDSDTEKKFAQDLDSENAVSVYVKLPRGFYINTPVGHYNPDWAIAFNEGAVKHIYFVAETKGSMSSMQLKKIEDAKIDCARVHFKAISSDKVKYDVVDNYESLLSKVMN